MPSFIYQSERYEPFNVFTSVKTIPTDQYHAKTRKKIVILISLIADLKASNIFIHGYNVDKSAA
jgi:hypothetical protein